MSLPNPDTFLKTHLERIMSDPYLHLRAAHKAGCRIQAWTLNSGADTSRDGYWRTLKSDGPPIFSCPAHLYRIHEDDLGLLPTEPVAEPAWYYIRTPGADYDYTFTKTREEAIDLQDCDEPDEPIPLYTTPNEPVPGKCPALMLASLAQCFRLAGGDTECSSTPEAQAAQAVEVVRDLRACYDELLTTPTEPAPDREDAERYRWLRDQNAITESPDAWTITRCDFADIEDPARYWVGTDLDAAIDDARQEQA